jgi:outer membrane protein assembly factor BamB
VDAATDATNCGGCGFLCGSYESCVSGACTANVNAWPTLGGNIRHTGFNPAETGTPPLSEAWRASLTTGALWPIVSDGTTIFVTKGPNDVLTRKLWALSPADGRILWTHDFGMVFGISQPAVDSGQVFVHQASNIGGSYVYAFDAATGAMTWSQTLTEQAEYDWAPVVVGHHLYFGGSGGLYGYETNAVFDFFQSVGGFDQWSPMYAGGNLYSFVDGHLRQHDPLTGVVRSQVDVNWYISSYSMQTAPVSDGTRVFFIVPSPGALYAVRPGQTSPDWTAVGPYAQMPVVKNGVVYAVWGGQLRAHDAATGAVQWTFVADGGLNRPPVMAGRWLYASSDTNLFAIDTATQTSAWTALESGWLAIAGGKLYVARADGTLVAYALTP